jgi:hypothetical protein
MLLTLLLLVVGASSSFAETKTGTITFGSATGSANVNKASVTAKDNLDNEWTITTAGTTSFTPKTDCSQIGSAKKSASTITFKMTLSSAKEITSVNAKFGGFSSTSGNVSIKVGDTQIGTGKLNATTDVTVSSTSAASGTELTISITGIAKGVKAYSISYTYEDVDASKTNTEVSFATSSYTFKLGSAEAKAFSGQKATVTANGTALADAKVTYSLETSNADFATIDANDGTVVLDESKTGTATVKAVYAGDDTYNGSEATYTITVNPKTTGDGTEANPYTVADLITLNSASLLPTDSVYVKGVISKLGKFYSNYGEIDYYVSDDGTENNQMEMYNGFGLNKAKFTALTGLETGWTVTVKGTPKVFNSTLELDRGNYITNIVKPSIPTPVIAGTSYFLDNTEVTLTADNADAKIYYTTDGTAPSETSTLYSAPFSLDKTTTVTAIAYVNGKAGKTATADFKKVEESELTTVADALTKDEGTVVYVKAKVARTETYKSSYLNYYLSDDGTNASTIEVYKGLGLNNAEITSQDQIARGDEVIIAGTVTTYGKTKELTNTTLLKLTEGAETATITNAGWATYVTKRSVDFSNAEVKAYTAKYDATANTITLSPVTTVPGNTAVVLKGNAGTYNLTRAESADAVSDNDLEYKDNDYTVTAEKTNYILAQNGDVCGFYPVEVNTTIAAYKGYIYIKNASAAKDFYAIGKTTTNINNALINNAQRGVRFNLNGQRVSDSYKGVVIENGKKFVVK